MKLSFVLAVASFSPSCSFMVPYTPAQARAARRTVVPMAMADEPDYTKGISPVLGGGKLSTDEPAPEAKAVEIGSAVAL